MSESTVTAKTEDFRELVSQYRSLSTLKRETEQMLQDVKDGIIEAMKEWEIDEFTGDDFYITYRMQTKKSFDTELLTEVLGDDLDKYKKETAYSVLRVK